MSSSTTQPPGNPAPCRGEPHAPTPAPARSSGPRPPDGLLGARQACLSPSMSPIPPCSPQQHVTAPGPSPTCSCFSLATRLPGMSLQEFSGPFLLLSGVSSLSNWALSPPQSTYYHLTPFLLPCSLFTTLPPRGHGLLWPGGRPVCVFLVPPRSQMAWCLVGLIWR